MAAELIIKNFIETSGLAGGDVSKAHGFTSSTVPAESTEHNSVLGNSAADLKLGDIAAGAAFYLYLEAVSGNFYVLFADTGTPLSTTAQVYLKEGTSTNIAINPDATANPGFRVIGDAATAKLKYILIGS